MLTRITKVALITSTKTMINRKMAYRISRTFIRSFSKECELPTSHPVFIGRDIINPLELTTHDIYSLIWTAFDLKCQRVKMGRAAFQHKYLQDKQITFLTSSFEPHFQGVLSRTVSYLGGTLNVVNYPYFEKTRSRGCEDLGKLLSTTSDLIVVRSNEQAMVEHLADGSSVPVIAARTEKFSILSVLADMMTVQEHFDRLEGLEVGWVGPPRATFNTYLAIIPRLGLNLKYHCCVPDEYEASPALLNTGMQNCIRHGTSMHETMNAAEAIHRTDVVAASETDCDAFHFGHKETKEAAINWILLHDFPRGKAGVTDQVFASKYNASWESYKNTTWITSAFILRIFEDVVPKTARPKFENV